MFQMVMAISILVLSLTLLILKFIRQWEGIDPINNTEPTWLHLLLVLAWMGFIGGFNMFLETYEVNIKLKNISEDNLEKITYILNTLREYGIDVDEGVYYTEENRRDYE